MAKLCRSILLFFIACCMLLPLLITLGASLMSKAELFEYISPILPGGTGRADIPLFPGDPTLRQYEEVLLYSPKLLSMFWNAIGIAVPIVLGQVIVGSLAAWGLARYSFPMKKTLYIGYITLMMMPFQVMMVPSYLALSKMHLIDTPWAIILPGIFNAFAVFILREFFSTVPQELIEAARMDGAGELRVFFSIGIQLGMPGIASLCTLSFLDVWNSIEAPMTFLATPGKWPLALYLPNVGSTNVDVAMAASVFALMPVLLLFLYCETFLVKGIQIAGLKA